MGLAKLDSQLSILGGDDPPAVVVARPEGTSPIFLTCGHAGKRIPRSLDSLQLDEPDLSRHIAWDIGAADMAGALSERFDATLVSQTYSRLVIDCNRPTEVPGSIPEVSDGTPIPGNIGIDPRQAEARIAEIFRPYHERIAALLDARRDAGRPTLLVAVHSFTPVFGGIERPWHIGLAYNRDRRLAAILIELLALEPGLCVGDNEPYSTSDTTDYTLPVHGEQRGIPHVQIEVRQDLVGDAAGRARWIGRIEKLLTRGLGILAEEGGFAQEFG